MDFKKEYDRYLDIINKALDEYVKEKDTPEKSIYKAMKYSITAGGKRLRPVLALAVTDMLGGSIEDVLPFACAIEMIHTYSLIHDDLPSMDNDDYRRGRLTSHKVFGEALAILAGDALLNLAFETMLDHLGSLKDIRAGINAAGFISKASGTTGMIGGQVVDMENEGGNIPSDLLYYMHACKTGALIKAPVICAGILCGAGREQMDSLNAFSEKIGLSFQIKDDILDIEGDFDDLGKKTGSDIANNKTTFVSLYGLQNSKELLDKMISEGIEALNCFGEKALFLKEIAGYIASRKN